MFNFANMGGWEWAIVLVLVLIFFGAGKLPQVFQQFGKATKAFKDAQKEDPEVDVTPKKLASTGVTEATEVRAAEKETA